MQQQQTPHSGQQLQQQQTPLFRWANRVTFIIIKRKHTNYNRDHYTFYYNYVLHLEDKRKIC